MEKTMGGMEWPPQLAIPPQYLSEKNQPVFTFGYLRGTLEPVHFI
jgi:hypothetical protein